MLRRILAWTVSGVGSVCVAAALTGCSAGSAPIGGNDGGGGHGAGSGSGANGMGGGFTETGGNDPGPGSGCSSDLQNVVNEAGQVVSSCPPNEGCAGGTCIPACDAAAASKGSIGCEYFAPTPAFYVNEATGSQIYDGACHAVFVANTWGRSAKLTVSRGGTPLDATTFSYIPSGVGSSTVYTPLPSDGIPPGEVAVVFLAHKPGVHHGLGSSLECPRAPAVLQDTAVQETGTGVAFEISSDTPITAYDIMPYGGAVSYLPSASLVFPSTAWGTNYYAIAPHPLGGGGMWAMIVGTEDNTTVDMLFPGQSATQITINRGQMQQWMSVDPIGAIFQSSAPIGLWTGNTYLRVTSGTSGGGGQDSAHQQVPPISSLGSEYVGAGIVTRLSTLGPEDVPYRMLGIVDGTTLTYDPAPPPGAPTSLSAGQMAEFNSSGLFTVASQDADHPFAFSQYMPGTFTTRPGCAPEYAGSCGLGDEEWVIQLPPQQFLQRYAFFTDPTYATTNLVITRVAGTDGFADVDIACLGTVSGWQPVGSSGKYEVAHVDLFRGFVGTTAECQTSTHDATSAGAFGVTVWGTDYYASYGYPAGGNIGVINDVVVPPVE